MAPLKRYLLEDFCYHTISTTKSRFPVFADENAARLLVECITGASQGKAFIIAYALMPDHLHLILVPRAPFTLPQAMQSIKGYSARLVNERMGRRGALWAASYYDRAIRSEAHLRRVVEYVHQNPVKAGLARVPEAYEFSSAHSGVQTGLDAWLDDDRRGWRASPTQIEHPFRL